MLQLPVELLRQIARNLQPERDISALARTNRRLYECVNDVLYHYDVRENNSSSLFWAAASNIAQTAKLAIVAGASKLGEALCLSAKNECWQVTKAVLAGCGDQVNFKDESGRSALHWSVSKQHLDTVKLLLATEGVETELQDKDGQTPLILAAHLGLISAVRLLLEAGANVNTSAAEDMDAFEAAITVGHEDIALLLLKTGQVKSEARGPTLLTPLIRVAELGLSSVAQYLVREAGVDINSKDREGQCALSISALHGREPVVQLLINSPGVEIESRDSFGRTPFWRAASHGHMDIVKLFIDTGKVDINSKSTTGGTVLAQVAMLGHEIVLKYLLDIGAEADVRDEEGWTPLKRAAQSGNAGIVQLLLDTGKVDVVPINDSGKMSAISWAIVRGHKPVLELLLANGADPTRRHPNNTTALTSVAWSGHVEILQVLLDTGKIDVNATLWKGVTAMSIASAMGNTAVVALLLASGAYADPRCSDGITPLAMAAMEGHEETVAVLLDSGALDVNVNSLGNFGGTPLCWAAAEKHVHVVKRLLGHPKINPNLADEDGLTPLILAARGGSLDIVRLLMRAKGIDMNMKDGSGNWSALGFAVVNSRISIVGFLSSEQSVDVNFEDMSNRTPVTLAKFWQLPRLVTLLLKTGRVHLGYNSDRDNELLFWAAEHNHGGVMRLLIDSKKVNFNAQNEEGQTPLSLATSKGHRRMVSLLLRKSTVDVHSKDIHGRTAIALAMEREDRPTSDLLRAYGSRE